MRVHSTQQPVVKGKGKKETHDIISKLVVEELSGAVVNDVAGFIEHKIPNGAIPFLPADALERLSTRSQPMYDVAQSRWIGWPDTHIPSTSTGSGEPILEAGLAEYLNTVASAISSCEGDIRIPSYRWNAAFATKPIPDAKCDRKPDLVALNHECEVDAVRWSSVKALFELKHSSSARTEAFNQLGQGARLVFGSQANRRFVYGIALLGSTMTLSVFSRSGRMTSVAFDVHEQPQLFLRVAIGILFLNPTRLGYDPTISLEDNRKAIEVNGKSFQIVGILNQDSVIRGRGTVCFKVIRDGRTFVIKDSWVDESRINKEWELLELANDVEGMARLEEHELIKVNGEIDSTGYDLALAGTDHGVEIRRHVRLVLSTVGSPIHEFKNKRELLGAFIDVTKAHKVLYEEKKILHRDISLRNILLAEIDNVLIVTRRRGLLIDLDYAIKMDDEYRVLAKGERTGTVPFMAYEVLTDPDVEHDARHDIESLFYAFCWICVTTAGPNKPRRRKDFEVGRPKIFAWSGQPRETFEAIGERKQSSVSTPPIFEKGVLKDFHPYFDDLRECARRLRTLIFPYDFPNNAVTHDTFLGILEDAYNSLPEEGHEDVDPTASDGTPNGGSPEDDDRTNPLYAEFLTRVADVSTRQPDSLKRRKADLDYEEDTEDLLDDEGVPPGSRNLPASIGSLRGSDRLTSGKIDSSRSANKRSRR